MEIFEIKAKDAGARIGKLRTRNCELETPAFFPVLNPHIPVVSPKDLKKVGFDSVITNAYSLYQDEKLREKTREEGLKKAYHWDGMIATDSGAFQLWQYKDFEISNIQICEFQKEIKTDIGVILDVPFGKGGKKRKREAIKTTAKRAQEIADEGLLEIEETILMAPLHGAPHNDLLRSSIKRMTSFPFKMYAVGSIVPLMKDYKYLDLLKSLLFIKRKLSSKYPIHLFGAGHPIAFALFTLLGFDTFDSASYAKFAKNDRYMTSHGSYKLKNLRYFPCECPICSSWTVKELQDLDKMKRRHYLTMHNLYVIKREMDTIKQAIRSGRLWKLVSRRIESHPKLAKAYKWLLKGKNENIHYFESKDPIYKKSGLFITREEEFARPQIFRYKRRISRRKYIWAKKVIITDKNGVLEVPNRVNAQVFLLDPVFGIIPREIMEVYPLFQHESFIDDIPSEMFSFITRFLKDLEEEGIDEFFIHNIDAKRLKQCIGDFESMEDYSGRDLGILDENKVLSHKIKALLKYQFGPGAEKAIKTPIVRRSGKTERIRAVYEKEVSEEELQGILSSEIKTEEGKKDDVRKRLEEKEKWLLAALVPQNYKLVPHPLLAWRLKNLIDKRYTITVKDEAVPFIRDGKSVFAKFVSDASEIIRANDEVLILSKEAELIAIGNAVLSGREMIEFNRGVAVENRWGRPK